MRLREPAAWVALGALVLNLVLALVGLATFEGPLVSMGWMWSDRVANPTCLLALAVLVSSCVLLERTPHARQLTLISLIVGVIAVLLGLTLALLGIGATAPILVVLAAIVPQVISIFAVGLLIKFLQLQAAPRPLPAGIGLVVPEPIGSDLDQERIDSSDLSPTSPAHAQQLQSTSQTDTAAGEAWVIAVEATTWAPATGWDTPTVRLQDTHTPTNGSRSGGWTAGDPAIQRTVPMPEQQPPSPSEDPQAGRRKWKSKPLALDWSDNPRS